MIERNARRGAGNQPKGDRAHRGLRRRPDRIALWALLLAVGVMVIAAASAQAGSGGLGAGGGGGVGPGAGGSTGALTSGRYSEIWTNYSGADRRWAHSTSHCESGNDPTAVGGGGAYRGAFQFTRPAWKNAPKSPGGDPITYSWRTQAVVAVALKHQLGTKPWPVCG
jgi:hypothetical protein